MSLGGFGGYIIVGFDHSIAARGLEYDFAIQGNAFGGAGASGQSNEPGVVWVMQDDTDHLPTLKHNRPSRLL